MITDAQSGQYAVVNADKTTVSLKDKNGNIIWSTDVAKALKRNPALAGETIDSMTLFNNKFLWAKLGLDSASLNLQTGEVEIVVHD